ncbi:MAG: preprotein translocase subunit SecE [Deltaproteobacteria bacterium]|nr:preprotein translocase subunit SecE [Deltaproteobacteria bacterium]
MEQQSGGRQPQGGLGQVVQFVPRSAEFVKESWQELKKVHWPTRKETYSATVIVIVAVVVVATFLGLVDFALSYAMQYILGNA